MAWGFESPSRTALTGNPRGPSLRTTVPTRKDNVNGTLRDPTWYRIGRYAAWINAGCFLGAAVLYLLVDLEVTWERAEFTTEQPLLERMVTFFATEEDRWAQQLVYSLLFAIGFLALIPIGLALRDLLGRNLAISQMIAASFLAAGVIGCVDQLAFIGGKDAILEASRCAECQESAPILISLNSSLTTLDGIFRWVGLGFFLLAGSGTLFASFAAFDQPAFARGWIRIGMAVGLLYLGGVVAGAYDLDTAFQIIVGVGGGILAPIWAAWLAIQLSKAERFSPPEQEDPVPAKV